MSEVMHTVEHMLGLCGEKHISLFAIIAEWPNFNHAINYIKLILNLYNNKTNI